MNIDEIIAQLGGMDVITLIKGVLFFIFGFIGMVVAYSFRWARDKVPVTLYNYLTGDKHEIGAALAKLLTACWVGGSMSYLDPMQLNDLVTAGILLGMAIPNKVDDDKAKQKELVKNVGQSGSNKAGSGSVGVGPIQPGKETQ